ncbi:MAG: hypothetical protein HQM16_17675 [Deltaproteobacteria bacterium]|nr:hypothetical protein [Deltaproteobacteria bacterium]
MTFCLQSIPSSLQAEASFALSTMPSLARLAEDIRRAGAIRQIQKSDHSIVTTADIAVDADFIGRVERAFPSDTVLSEESADCFDKDPQMAGVVAQFLQINHHGLTPSDVVSRVKKGETETLSNRTWVLDPIDKTHAFISGGIYAINLSFFNKGEIELALIAYPNLKQIPGYPPSNAGVMILAIKDYGAYYLPIDFNDDLMSGNFKVDRARVHTSQNGGIQPRHSQVSNLSLAQRIKVSAVTDPRQARFLSPKGLFEWDKMSAYDIALLKGLCQTLPPEEQHLFMGLLDRYRSLGMGIGDALVSPSHWTLPLWDHAAGVFMVQEAGGRVTDMFGDPVDLKAGRMIPQKGILASNGVMHDKLLNAIASAKKKYLEEQG